MVIILNLLDGTCKPYLKPKNTSQYIHKEFNHSPSIKQIIITIKRPLSNHSSNEIVYCHAAEDYEKALKKLGYNVKLQYKPIIQNANNKINCKRNVIWFNPPFIETVSTKLGHYFLNRLDNHFPKNYKFSNIFKRNNIKASYSCTKNKIICNTSETLRNNAAVFVNKNTYPVKEEC